MPAKLLIESQELPSTQEFAFEKSRVTIGRKAVELPPGDAGLGGDIREYGSRMCIGSDESGKEELTKADSRERMKEAAARPSGIRLVRDVNSGRRDAKRLHGFPAGIIAAVVPLSSVRFRS